MAAVSFLSALTEQEIQWTVEVSPYNFITYEKHFYDFGFVSFVCGLQTRN